MQVVRKNLVRSQRCTILSSNKASTRDCLAPCRDAKITPDGCDVFNYHKPTSGWCGIRVAVCRENHDTISSSKDILTCASSGTSGQEKILTSVLPTPWLRKIFANGSKAVCNNPVFSVSRFNW